ILGTALFPVLHTSSIQGTTHDVVTYARQIFYPSATDQYDGVFLQVMTFTWNVRDHLYLVCQTHLGYLAQSRVRFLRSGSVHTCTYATTLRTSIQRSGFGFGPDNFSSFSY